MSEKKKQAEYEQDDLIGSEFQEDISDEEMLVLVQEAQQEALQRAQKRREKKPKRPFPKWVFWLISFAMFINVIAFLPQTISLPAIDFLITSATLSQDDTIKTYKKSVAVIKADKSRGTGFVFTDDGELLTNYHVIEGHHTVTVNLPDVGFYEGEVVETYPDIDLAVVKIDATDLTYLPLSEDFTLEADEKVHFIGNPLNFIRIANEGSVLNYIHVSSKPLPVVMMNAPVYRGNSGSPVINEAGNVIGVIYATMRHDEAGKVGLFIPIHYFHDVR